MKKYPIYYNGNKYEVSFEELSSCDELEIRVSNVKENFLRIKTYIDMPLRTHEGCGIYSLYSDNSIYDGLDRNSDDYYIRMAELSVKKAVEAQLLLDDLEAAKQRKIQALNKWDGVIKWEN